MNKEYVIWGKANPEEEEKLLVTKVDGYLITDHDLAVATMKVLEKKYHCTECRIQTLELDYPKSLNKLFMFFREQ